MDSKRAAEVLRGIPAFERSINQLALSLTAQAADLGAQALEAWAWVERMGVSPTPHGSEWFVMGHTPKSGYVDGIGPTPLAAVLAAMEKKKG